MFLDFVQKRANIQLFNQSRKRMLPFNAREIAGAWRFG